ncbi:hypothetical protein [Saccharibacillus kuerlensis]|uniref:Cell division protein FtsQ n=1 Tax=Saccharibacillus kuerlensis TaxID=459527 RepID=A0ABQ2KRQ4_9BACL|nr:hypothetical protein [Saccharibacillus kuerlensis]GGN91264.1 hypothetical protein GCM10010969_02740 [Saccharibacillus kuerlensis]
MAAKRKPPVLQQKKEQVNRKAALWIGGSIALFILAVSVLIVWSQL